MPGTSAPHSDRLHDFERVHLEKLRLAAQVILELGEDDLIVGPLETDLTIFKDRVEVALLLPESAANILPWREPLPPDGPPPRDKGIGGDGAGGGEAA